MGDDGQKSVIDMFNKQANYSENSKNNMKFLHC